MDDLALNYQSDFNAILQMIADARRKAAYQVNATMIDLYWGIGEFVSNKAVQDGWGRSTVKALSEYILTQEPGIRGYSPQNIWRMKQFFETYCDKPELGTLLRENICISCQRQNRIQRDYSIYDFRISDKKISKEILQKKLEELTEMVDEDKTLNDVESFSKN